MSPTSSANYKAMSKSLESDQAAISATHLPTVAFFGATGGCTLASLSHALKSGYYARALARTPSKLQDMLKQRQLSQALLDAKLVIIQGNAKNEEDVRKVLINEKGELVDQIASGLGGAPKFTPNPLRPTIDDPHVCQDSMITITTVLQRIAASGQTLRMPLLSAISTTGLSQSRDIPIAMVPLYHWMLGPAHADKKLMEDRILEAKEGGWIRDFVIVRASLLLGEARKEVRVGWEGKAPGQLGDGAAVGYTISREDVGLFVYRNIIAQGGGDLVGKKVSITH
ncbi:MAG: hypothetical protein LQ352_001640 [Teloschistes flavicans]|nr:MAG: hypothetical protein LQ352_001640 [Teloschistes flavicans]